MYRPIQGARNRGPSQQLLKSIKGALRRRVSFAGSEKMIVSSLVANYRQCQVGSMGRVYESYGCKQSTYGGGPSEPDCSLTEQGHAVWSFALI